MIYLAQFTLRTSYYMSNDDKIQNLTRLVEADDIKDAKAKIYKHYKVDYTHYDDNHKIDESKSFEFEYDYGSSNRIDDIDISEIIK